MIPYKLNNCNKAGQSVLTFKVGLKRPNTQCFVSSFNPLFWFVWDMALRESIASFMEIQEMK